MDRALAAKVELLAELSIDIADETRESPLDQEGSLIDAMERR